MESYSNFILTLSTPFPFSPGILVPILYKSRIVLAALSSQYQADCIHTCPTTGCVFGSFFTHFVFRLKLREPALQDEDFRFVCAAGSSDL